MISMVEGEYGMNLTLVTASDRKAFTVANILVGDDYLLFFCSVVDPNSYGMFMVSSGSVIICTCPDLDPDPSINKQKK